MQQTLTPGNLTPDPTLCSAIFQKVELKIPLPQVASPKNSTFSGMLPGNKGVLKGEGSGGGSAYLRGGLSPNLDTDTEYRMCIPDNSSLSSMICEHRN